MRSYPPAYELMAPKTLQGVLDLLSAEPEVWKPFAGGTDLMVLFEAGKLAHKKFISIWDLAELKGIEESPAYVSLGALTTYTDVQRSSVLRKEFPLLCRAAAETGGIATQNRGTLGGNIANASPAADSPPALLAYDAELELISSSGSRWIPYRDFHTGYKQMLLKPTEIVVRIRLPRGREYSKQYFRKVGARRAQAISKVCLAATAQSRDGKITDIRIALASVAPTVVRCLKTEALLRGRRWDRSVIPEARAELSKEIAPIDDIRSSSDYRLCVAMNLLEEFLNVP